MLGPADYRIDRLTRDRLVRAGQPFGQQLLEVGHGSQM
jgi:hypothetical protein